MLIVAWILVGLFASVSLMLLIFRSRDRKKNVLNHEPDTLQNSASANLMSSRSQLADVHLQQRVGPAVVDDDRTMLVADDRTVLFTGESAFTQNVDPLEIYPYLTVVCGPDVGNIYPLPYGLSAVGRNDTNDIVLTDGTASRRHFEVAFVSPHFVLRDSGSTNGTFCNGGPVEEVVLEFGDEIHAAESQLIFTSRGFELTEQQPEDAIAAFEGYLGVEPEFLLALKNLAFLLERDIRRKREAEPLWKEVARLEKYK